MKILITGGASGLGETITSKLAENKDNFIYFTYFKSTEAAQQLEEKYKNVKGIFCDFSDEKSIEKLLDTMNELGLEVLINNALTSLTQLHFHKKSADSFLTSFQTNVMPIIRLSQKAIEIFRKNKFGKIITIVSSYVVNKPPVGLSEYVAEKNYILSLSNSIAVENASFNITSNCISPGFMLTELNQGVDERVIENMRLNHPLKKILTTQEATEAVIFLVNATQQINGTNMIINSSLT